MAVRGLNSEETTGHVLMSACRAKAVLLICVHLGAMTITALIGEVTHFVKLLLELLIAFAHDRETQIARVSLEAGIGPFTLSC